MAISRAQMGSQLTGNKMKKTKKMSKGGDMLAMISPAAAIAQSMKAGKPVGLANLSPVAHLMGRKNKAGAAASPEEAAATGAGGMSAMARPELPTRGMKKGGKVRGDGCCVRGKTKGTMR
jgi:hypothetical protein